MDYNCEKTREDIDFYFSQPGSTDEMVEALIRAVNHMTKETTKKKYIVSCPQCWEYYQELKRRYCGG